MTVRVCSLFAGIGGFEMGIDLSGIDHDVVFASEFTPAAVESYTHLFPDHPLHGDITKVDYEAMPDFDLLVGGFPCQAFSIAGKRRGFEETRGTLFFNVAEIMRIKRPRVALLENVVGLLNHDNGNTIRVIMNTLAELGYVVDIDILASSDFAVPQARERVYIVAVRKDLAFSSMFTPVVGRPLISELRSALNAEYYPALDFFGGIEPRPAVEHGRYTCIADALDPEPYRFYTKAGKEQELQSWLNEHIGDVDPVDPSYRGMLSLLAAIDPELSSKYNSNARVYHPQGYCTTLTLNTATPFVLERVEGEPRLRILSGIERLRLQGVPQKYIDSLVDSGLSNNVLAERAGNMVSPPVVAGVVSELARRGWLGG